MKTLSIVALAFCATPALATTYTLEPDYTQVVFSWDHLGFSHPTAQIAQGSGTLEFDPMQPTMASLQVTLPLASLMTGVHGLDEHLKSEDFFHVARYPLASFISTHVAKGQGDDRLEVTGNLTLHAVTRPVTLAVRILKVGSNPRTAVATVGFAASGRIRRSEFGLGAFVPQVGDEISLQIACQGAESKGYAAFLKAQEEKEQAKKR